MFQLLELLIEIFGESHIRQFFYFVSILGAILLFFYAIKQNLSFQCLVAVVGIMLLAALLMVCQEIFAEKTHVINYGLFGYFVIRDACRASLGTLKSFYYALCFTLLVSILDETFQWILPYRVGDLHDIIVNFLGSLFGLSLYLVLNPKHIGQR